MTGSFLVNEDIPQIASNIIQWVVPGGNYDQYPIVSEIASGHKPPIPFKFCVLWLEDDGYTNMIKRMLPASPL